jgi:2-haloalkanoic acid dehalogenase type II
MSRVVITFDLFSALLDSRSGGSAALDRLGGERGWAVAGSAVYDVWDRLNKAAQKKCTAWVPYPRLAERALEQTYDRLGLAGDPAPDVAALLASVPAWSPWPDVPAALSALAQRLPVGILSNVDDAIFEQTQVAEMVRRDLVFTSERLGVYKPDPRIYEGARDACESLVHVATSARDVRGALEAGIRAVRLRRPGHHLDPDGPTPPWQVDSVDELSSLLAPSSPFWGAER